MIVPAKQLGVQDYEMVWHAMLDYTKKRGRSEDDILWVVEHPSVFTQGITGQSKNVLNAGGIPIVYVDRGGQITYHGIGQAVIYLLLDIKTANISVRQFIAIIEQTSVEVLKSFNIFAYSRKDAPGVYVADGRKIASLGLKISRGCSYHGVAINVDMDLEPFQRINPCGLINMKMAQVSEYVSTDVAKFSQAWIEQFSAHWFDENTRKNVKK